MNGRPGGLCASSSATKLMGVSDTLASSVDTVIRIPMLGQKRSLNVATAAGVVLYELVRRRRSKDS